MSVSTNDLKRGMTLDLDGTLFQVIEFQHVKPGKGGAFVRTKLRNVRSGAVIERTFNAGVNVGLAIVERKEMQFLYRDGDDYHFMDTDSYDQFMLRGEQLGESTSYLKDGMTLDRTSYQGETIGVELPVTVDLKVESTEPGFAGDTAQGARKPATTETGLVVQVPLFVSEGDTIRVDTRTGEYQTRL
jgi:elongation factor P